MSESQNKMIFKHLLGGLQINPKDARVFYQCDRLAARIYDIKDVLRSEPIYKGWKVLTHMVKNNGKRFASYELVRK